MAVSSNKVAGLQVEATTDSPPSHQLLIPASEISGVDGWHYIQCNTGAGDPCNFLLTLEWPKNATDVDVPRLLKLRTDIDIATPDAEKMLGDVPKWRLSFGKSTPPYPLAYLATLPVEFNKNSAT